MARQQAPRPPIGLPAATVLINRYDYPWDNEPPKQITDALFNAGNPPGRIPRLWNISLGGLAGPDYSGWHNHNDQLKLTPPPIILWGRGERSIRLAGTGGGGTLSADNLGVPSIFVGWNGLGQPSA